MQRSTIWLVPVTAKTWDGIAGGKYHLIDTLPLWHSFYEKLRIKKQVACDTETTGLSHIDSKIIGFSFSWGAENSYYVPVRHETNEKQLDIDVIRPDLEEFFFDPTRTTIWHNYKFDGHFLREENLVPRGVVHDTRLKHSLLHEEQSTTALKKLATMEIHPDAAKWEVAIDEFRATYARKNKIPKRLVHYGLIPLELMVPYAASDGHYTWALYKKKLPQISSDSSLLELYLMESQLLWVLLNIEHNGVFVDRTYLEKQGPELEVDIKRLRDNIIAKLGNVNPDSNGTLIEPLQRMGVKLFKRTKSGDRFSLDSDVLEKLASKYQVCSDLKEYRQVSKIKSTYIDGILKKLTDLWQLHCEYNQVVSTGRMSSKSPNLQNIPSKDKSIRRAFIPPKSVICVGCKYEGKHLVIPVKCPICGAKVITKDDYIMVFMDYCLAKGTEVDTPDGLIPIEDIKIGQLVFTYRDRRPSVSRVSEVVHVGKKLSVKLTLDNGKSVVCTNEHRWLVCPTSQNSEPIKVLAGDLKVGDRLLPMRRVRAGGYVHLYAHKAIEYSKEHIIVAEAVLGPRPAGYDVHHKNEISTDNCPGNLEYKSSDIHKSDHGKVTAKKCWDDPCIRKSMSNGISLAVQERGGMGGSNNPRFGDRRQRHTSECLTCGKEMEFFASARKKYCSSKCYHFARSVGLNHKVVSIENVGLQDSWSIGIDKDHNYALGCGVFTCNSQMEIRMTAHYSRDPVLLDVFNITHQDVHLRTMCEVWGEYTYDEGLIILHDESHPDHNHLSEMRKIAKITNFLIIYGGGPSNLASNISTPKKQYTEAECRRFIQSYFERLKGVRRWITRTKMALRETGWVQNYFGRYRRFPELASLLKRASGSTKWMVERCERQAVNFLIQGTCADLFKIAMVRANSVLKDARSAVIMPIHDELVFYWHVDEFKHLSEVKAKMEDFNFEVPMTVDVSYSSTTWAEKRELKLTS
jgi:DNA polymerase I-like protein with 3'-5' exonuclease and polymerase domains/endogenous inhibitor of DNA gyrase (YacG/DUF329 family)